MATREFAKNVTFKHSFFLKSVGEELRAGTYRVTVYEETVYIRGQPVTRVAKTMFHLENASASLLANELEDALAADATK